MKYERDAATEAARIAVPVQQRTRGHSERVEPDGARAKFYAETLELSGVIDQKHYTGLARIIEHVNNHLFPHPIDETFTQISRRQWLDAFSDSAEGKQLIALVKDRLFDVEPSYQTDSHSMGFRLKLELAAMLAHAERSYDRRTEAEPKLNVRHHTRRGPNSIRLDKIPNYIDVDRESIEQGIRAITAAMTDHSDASAQTDAAIRMMQSNGKSYNEINRYLTRSRAQLITARAYAIHPDHQGQLPQVFRMAGNSRWRGVDYSLQSVTRLARKIALKGCFSYDIDCSMHSIIRQVCERDGLVLDGVRHYELHKQLVRERLAEDIDTTIPIVKEILIAIGFGATDHGWTIQALLTAEQRRTLSAHPLYRSLKDDLTLAFDHLVRNAELSNNGMNIVNAVRQQKNLFQGDGENRRELPPAKVANFLYTGHEVQVLMAMIRGARSPVLPVHDCLVSREREDINALRQSVLDHTGLDLSISEEVYT